MARVKGGPQGHRRHKKLLKQAEGYVLTRREDSALTDSGSTETGR